MEDKLKYRMYGLVPYNLSPIQQGIQFGHAVVEYMMGNFDSERVDSENPCNVWAENDKTFIILNGGTTNDDFEEWQVEKTKGNLTPVRTYIGSLNNHEQWLKDNAVFHDSFYEPDLGDQLTAVVFLVDERVWDYEKYPDFEKWLFNKNGCYLPLPPGRIYSYEGSYPEDFKTYIEFIGGETNYKPREWLKQFKLA